MDEFHVKIGEIDSNEWEECAQLFADYSIYQTIPYQENRARTDREELSRAIVYDKSGRPVIMCQARIKRLRGFGLRIGYAQWGPLVTSHGGELTCSTDALKAMVDAYGTRGVSIFRVVPNVWSNGTGESLTGMLSGTGFRRVWFMPPYRTNVIALNDGEEGIRERLHKSYRRDLRKAERNGFVCRQSRDTSFCAVLETLYEALVTRKNFRGLSTQEFNRPQGELCEAEKLTYNVVELGGEPVSVVLSSNLGKTGIVLLAATNKKGLETGASYLAWYNAAVSAYQAGMRALDLGGIDVVRNPAVAQFKGRMGGCEMTHAGVFDYCSNKPAAHAWHWLSYMWYIWERKVKHH